MRAVPALAVPAFLIPASLILASALVPAPATALPAAAPPPNRATAAIPARATPVALPVIDGAHDGRLPLIVIDAGHGGHDPGSSGPDGTREKAVALAIARAIRDRLLAGHDVRVALTRDDDRFLALAERREAARALDADLFLSVHCDSAPRPEARGLSIYTLAERSSDPAAHALARRENRADRLDGVALSGEASVPALLLGLARRETRDDAAAFARDLQQALGPRVGVVPDLRAAGLMVLRAPDVPSVLLETGFISNRADLARLKSPAYRRDVAQGVTDAVRIYLAHRPADASSKGETR